MMTRPQPAVPDVLGTEVEGAYAPRHRREALAATARGRRRVLVHLLAGSIGLLVTCAGYVIGWSGGAQGLALTFFYAGFLLSVAPPARVLIGTSATSTDRLIAVLGLGLLLYLGFALSNPLLSSRFDEMLHVATLRDLVQGDGLFTESSTLPISPFYPGLELETVGVMWLTGLPATVAQFVVVATARTVMLGAFFWIAARITGSCRTAGLACLLYMASSQFWFFNAQFSYQTVALTYAVLIGATTLRLVERGQVGWRAVLPVVPFQICATISHHVSGWIITAVMIGLAGWLRGRSPAGRLVLKVSLVGALISALWTTLLFDRLEPYLRPIFVNAAAQFGRILGGDLAQKKLFTASSGAVTPTWQVGLMLAYATFLCLLASLTAWSMLRGRLPIGGSLSPLVTLLIGGFPVLFAARFAPAAAEVAERASTYVFLVVSIGMAAWLTRTRPRGRPARWRVPAPLLALGAGCLLLGGCVLGSGPDPLRVPGPFMIAAQQRSLDAEVYRATAWMADNIPDDARYISDFTFYAYPGTRTDLFTVDRAGAQVNLARVFYMDDVDASLRAELTRARVTHLIVDSRLSQQKPLIGFYYPQDLKGRAIQPTEAQLRKWDDVPGVRKIYSGVIDIYDLTGLTGVHLTRPPAASGPDRMAGDPARMGMGFLLLGAAGAFLRRRSPVARDFGPASRPAWFALGGRAMAALVALGLCPVLLGAEWAMGWPGTIALTGILTLVGMAALAGRGARASSGADASTPRPALTRATVALGAALLLVISGSTAVATVAAYDALVLAHINSGPV